MIRLNKVRFFLTGFIFIVACYFVRQVDFIMGSEVTEGYVIKEKDIVYEVDGKWLIMVAGDETRYYEAGMPPDKAGLLGEEVPVIYKKEEPRISKIYTFFGFWFSNIAYFIVPLFLWSAFSLSYIDKGEYLLLDFRNKRFGKTSQKSDNDPTDWPGPLKLE